MPQSKVIVSSASTLKEDIRDSMLVLLLTPARKASLPSSNAIQQLLNHILHSFWELRRLSERHQLETYEMVAN
jgi:hypothetical protein